MRAIHLSAYGNPVESLGLADVPEPKAPGANEALVAIEYSPIDPSDLLVARGVYPLRPELPSVIGNEGVGRVLAVGPGVTNVAVGGLIASIASCFGSASRGNAKRPPAGMTMRSRQTQLERGGTTRSPSARFVTPGPSASTRPTPSLPMTDGSSGRSG